VACTDISDALKCNGGAGYNNAASAGAARTHNIKTRLVLKAGNTAAIQVGGDSSAYNWTWNNDLVLASFYQPSGSVIKNDGTQWCSSFLNKLSNDDPVELVASRGMTGRAKCTFEVLSDDGEKGIVVNLIRADYMNFLLHWVEWPNLTSLGTNSVLSSDIQGNYHIGNYASAAGDIFLNPLKTSSHSAETTWNVSPLTYYYDIKDPKLRLGGSIGDATFKPGTKGPFEDS